MSTDAEIAQRHSRMLLGLAERAYDLACALQEEAMAASGEERAALAKAFEGAARSMRQSIALEIRVRREADRLAADTARADADARDLAVMRRGPVSRALSAMLWKEYEPEDAEEAAAEIPALVEAAAGDPAFGRQPVELIIGRLETQLRALADTIQAARREAEGYYDDEEDEAPDEDAAPFVPPGGAAPAPDLHADTS